MRTNQPLVSILMNCYNGETYLRAAIESVLSQTYQNWELIFWDNQSTDNSAEICKSYKDSRIKYFYADQHTNLGAGRALAFEKVSGDFTAILDTDDLWLSDKLERQIPLFDDPQVGIVICDTLFFTDEGRERQLYKSRLPKQGFVFNDLIKFYFVSLETVVLRTLAIKNLTQAFDPDFKHVADMDIIVRLSKDWKLACVPAVLAKWRVHQQSGTWSAPEHFFKERRAFVTKMDQLSDYAPVWKKSRRRFIQKIYSTEAARLLAMGRPIESRQLLKECPEKGLLSFAVNIASWLPFSGELVARYRTRRNLA